MSDTFSVINNLLVQVFNDILYIEQASLKKGPFNDLSMTEIHTLEAIGINGDRTMTEVASDLKITVGTLTTAINKLIKKEYVSRNRIEEDRRVVKISLTQKGETVFKVHESFHTNMVEAIIAGLNQEDEKILIRGLSSLNIFFKSMCDKLNDNDKDKEE